MLGAMKSHPLQLFVLAVVAVLAGCSKKPGRRAQVVECSSISLDAKGTVQCRDLQTCSHADDQLRSCLLVAGWPLSRVKTTQDSMWNAELSTHRHELQTCVAKRDFNLSSCLTLYYKWDSDRALATADSVTRARLAR